MGWWRAAGNARASALFALVATVLVLASGTGVLGPLTSLTFPVLAVAATTGTVIGLRRWRPAPLWPWTLLVFAFALFLAGGAAREVMHTLGDRTASRSLLPDLVTMPGYALIVIALGGFARSRRNGRAGNLDLVLDAAVAGLAALTLAWVYLITPALAQEHAPLSVRLLLAAYPTLSVFIVAIGMQIVFSTGARVAYALRFLMVAMVLMLTGDVVYMLADAGLADIGRNILDTPYALSFVAITAAVLHPSMRQITQPIKVSETAPTTGRLLGVALSLALPGLVQLHRGEASPGDRAVTATIVLVLTTTAVWRQVRALHQHAASQRVLAHQATHDALTGLPNGTYLRDHLSRLVTRGPSSDTGVALIFLDLDRFRLVNESLGHSVGDRLLVAVAERLRKNLGPEDLVSRVGGDEFAVVLDGVEKLSWALGIGERLRLSFSVPINIDGKEIPITASVGMTYVAPGDSTDPESLLRDADTAMYQAKDAGGNAVAAFDEARRDAIDRRVALERELRRALERGQLAVHYQPIVETGRQCVVGMEALLRWTHPTLGEIQPSDFIPVAEETGLIVPIGAWVLGRACRDLSEIRLQRGAENLFVSVNLSMRQTSDMSLLDHVARGLRDNGLPPEALELELTESLIMDNAAGISELLARLRSYGVQISIDDFGTGYSSLAYLQQLPVDKVKIDRSFVAALGTEDSTDGSLVSAVVAMTRSLGILTIAEGVETVDQHRRLQAIGCDFAQGYLFSRAVPRAALGAVIRRLGVSGERHLQVAQDPA